MRRPPRHYPEIDEGAERVGELAARVQEVEVLVAVLAACVLALLWLSDRPGGLAEILTAVEKSGINVEYMYAFTVKREGKGLLVFRFDDPDRAAEALKKKGVNLVGSDDLMTRI